MTESSTTILRRMLDERGVEWEAFDDFEPTTWWSTHNGAFAYWARERDGKLLVETTAPTKCSASCTPEQAVEATLGQKVTGNTSDGYHTFNELYHHRAVLFSVIVRDHRELAWKSMRHHDGTMYDGMFIVGIETPEGQATYHYDIDPYWDMFNCKELDQAPEWDGHTPSEAIERIATLGSCSCTNDCTNGERTETCEMEYVSDWMSWHCKSCDHMDMAPRNPKPRYCKWCGRKVVDPTTNDVDAEVEQ